MTIKVFLSFAHTSKRRAMWLKERLLSVGHEVTLEDDFGVGSPRKEMLQAIQDSDVVVSIVSPEYPSSAGAQRELDLAEAHGKDVVAIFAGLDSRSPQARPYAAYRRVELDEVWNDADDQWGRIVGLVVHILNTKSQRNTDAAVTGLAVRRDATAAICVEEAIFFYDIEDRLLAHQLLAVRTGW
ncbi:MAG: toll/interleukin-1 receptor domain-containing protein [Actinomycetota bacterium]|nr:toll/interleukin-1 receptor domain-containing protein [Actinomycetota bacterium]